MSSGGLSTSRLQRLHDAMAAYVDRGEVPGVITLVSRRGEVAVDCIGYERDTIFRLGSMTKPIVAAAALILVEDAVIRLDDPIGKWLPELANPRVLRAIDAAVDDTVPANRAINVRDLLANTLGTGAVIAPPGTYPIQQALLDAGFGSSEMPDADGYLKALATVPLVIQPGDAWMYNTGSNLLGILVERAAHSTLGEFARERIFEPLGMRDTGFTVRAERLGSLPAAYIPDGTGSLRIADPAGADSEFSRPHAFESGGSGAVTTIDDWSAFVSMLLNLGSAGSTRILSRPTVEAMTCDQLTAEQKSKTVWTPGWFDTRGWGFGVGVITRRFDITSTPGKYGWEGYYGTSWSNDPREELVITAMTQVARWPRPIVGDFATLAYAALE